MEQFRWHAERVDDLYKKRGFGIWYERGSLGTEYGDPRRNMFFTAHLLVLRWEFAIRLNWKKKAEE